MDRRVFLSTLGAAAVSPSVRGGLALNEDSNHYFASRAGRRLSAVEVSSFVDRYAGTQIRELLVNVNAMRACFPSKTRTSFFDGYDPDGPGNQPIFASVSPREAKFARAWVHQAWQLRQDGIDPYRLWLDRARRHRIGAWVPVRMNDLHNVDDERHYLHSEFWESHPELRRVSYRQEQRDKALDYLHPQVRAHNLSFIEEVASRYGFDGMELDWMRFGFHFQPGREAEGARLLTEFHRRVRRVLGPKRRIAVRVPSRPETAQRLGWMPLPGRAKVWSTWSPSPTFGAPWTTACPSPSGAACFRLGSLSAPVWSLGSMHFPDPLLPAGGPSRPTRSIRFAVPRPPI